MRRKGDPTCAPKHMSHSLWLGIQVNSICAGRRRRPVVRLGRITQSVITYPTRSLVFGKLVRAAVEERSVCQVASGRQDPSLCVALFSPSPCRFARLLVLTYLDLLHRRREMRRTKEGSYGVRKEARGRLATTPPTSRRSARMNPSKSSSNHGCLQCIPTPKEPCSLFEPRNLFFLCRLCNYIGRIPGTWRGGSGLYVCACR